jgi:DNA-binding CsgD family transcriptional regulator
MNVEPIEKADPPETVRLIPRECGENPDGPSPDTAGPGDEIVGIARKIEDARGRMEALASEMRTLESLTERAMGERDRGAGVPRLNEGIELRLLAAPISAREREVLALLLEGKSNREIALGLGISVKTVKDHLWKAYRVIGVKSRTQLFHWLISP